MASSLTKNVKDFLKLAQTQNFIYLLLNHALGNFLIFYAFSLLAKNLSVENFGKFGFSQAFNNYFIILLTLGIPIYSVKKFVQINSEKEQNIFVNQIVSLRILILLIALVPYFIITFLVAKDQITIDLIFIMGIVLLTLPVNFEWYFQAIQKMYFIAIANIVKSGFFFIGVYLVVKSDFNVLEAGMIYALSFIIQAIFLILPNNNLKNFKITFRGKWKNEILKESIILGISFMLIQVYYSFGILILGLTRPAIEVGYFTSIYKLLLFFLMGISMLVKVIFPYMASIVTNPTKFQKFVENGTRFLFLISLFITIFIFFLSELLIEFIFGSKYLEAVGAFKILIFIFIIIASRAILENSLIIQNQSNKFLFAVAMGASTNIVLNIILTPIYGISATATINLLSEIVFTILIFKFTGYRILNLIKIRL